MDLSIIITSYNTQRLTKDCISSIVKNTKGIKYEIIVVENASSDDSLLTLRRLQKQHANIRLLVNKKNIGFGAGNNQAMKMAKGRYFLLLNSDTVVGKILPEMINWMDNNRKVGISSCKLLNKDKSTQGTGGYFPTLLSVFSWMIIQDLPLVDRIIKPFHPQKSKLNFSRNRFYETKKQLDWLTGAFLLIRKEVYDKVGDFDSDYFMYVEEVDYCYQAKKLGWEVWYLPKWSILHYGAASGKAGSHIIKEYEGLITFYKKNMPKWQMPLLRLFLKVGAFWRMIVFGLIEGRGSAVIYAKAFKVA